MTDHCDPFPPFPTETIISIIETAAKERDTALNLCLVSKAVYSLIKPILYHSIQVKWYNFQRFHQWFFSFSPIDPYKHHRSLIRDLTIVCLASYLFRIVDTCDKLDRLVCSADVVECTSTKSRPRELIICTDNETLTLYGGHIHPGVVTESVTHLYVNLPVLGVSLRITMGDPGAEEGVIDGMLGLLDIERLAGIFVYDRSTTITGVWERLAKVEDKRLVVAIQAVVDWKVDPVRAACSGVSPWEKMKELEDWRRGVSDF